MLASLLASLVSGHTATAFANAKKAFVAYVLAFAAAVFGAVFLVVALYVWAAQRYGSLDAAIWIGVAFLVLAAIIVGIHKLAASIRARREARRRKADFTAAGVAATVAVLPSLMRRKRGAALLLAPVVGLAAYVAYRLTSNSDPED